MSEAEQAEAAVKKVWPDIIVYRNKIMKQWLWWRESEPSKVSDHFDAEEEAWDDALAASKLQSPPLCEEVEVCDPDYSAKSLCSRCSDITCCICGACADCQGCVHSEQSPPVEENQMAECTCQKEGSGRCKYPHPCRHCYAYHPGVSCYWATHGKTTEDKKRGRTFERSDGSLGCDECCNGDRCDDHTHYYRDNCPYCLGSGSPKEFRKEKR